MNTKTLITVLVCMLPWTILVYKYNLDFIDRLCIFMIAAQIAIIFTRV